MFISGLLEGHANVNGTDRTLSDVYFKQDALYTAYKQSLANPTDPSIPIFPAMGNVRSLQAACEHYSLKNDRCYCLLNWPD